MHLSNLNKLHILKLQYNLDIIKCTSTMYSLITLKKFVYFHNLNPQLRL